MAKKTSIGGQALIEGIMMRGPEKTAMAVRNIKTKEITLEEYPTKGADRPKICKLPFIAKLCISLRKTLVKLRIDIKCIFVFSIA